MEIILVTTIANPVSIGYYFAFGVTLFYLTTGFTFLVISGIVRWLLRRQ